MKRHIPKIAWLLCLSWALSAQTVPPPSITVTGDAEVRVVPDEVVINVGVQSVDPLLANAKSSNDAAMSRAIEIAKTHGVLATNLQTDFIYIEPHYRDGDVSRGIDSYVVRKSLTIRLRKIAEFEPLLADLLNKGVNVVNGIQFRTTELRKYRDQARVMAIKAAREKAEAMAASAGVTAGKALSISEFGGGWYSPYASWWGGRPGQMMMQNVAQNAGGGASEEGSDTAPGQITITAHVNVAYALQ